MLQISNDTGLATSVFVSPDLDGVDTVYTIVKGTFVLEEGVPLAAEQVPVTMAAEHFGDPAMSSIRIPSDIACAKPGTDVLLRGSAWAPRGTPTWQMDVSLSVGGTSKTVRVSGDRVWDSGAGGASIAWVAPFERMPLTWERAFGGVDETDSGPRAEPRNPVGRGYRAPNGRKPLAGMPLPNLEDPASPIRSWKDAPAPACFAPIAPHWEPRASRAGTYDDRWQRERAPFLPTDFDPRFFQLAPPDLVSPRHLRGGEFVDVRGATPAGVLQFPLPAVEVLTRYDIDGTIEDRPAPLDTVVIDTDASLLTLVWRSALRADKRVLRVREIAVTASGSYGGS